MDNFLRDARFGLRLLWKQKAFSLTAALTLAICIAANVAIFSVVYNVILKPLPFPDSGRLVHIYNSYPKAGVQYGSTGVPDYYDRKSATDVFEEVAAFNFSGLTLGAQGEAERITVMRATPSLFPVLRAQPAMGRALEENDGQVGNEHVVVLSDGLWKRISGGRDEALGQPVRLNGIPYTVIGVMPPAFQFWNTEVSAWIPLAFTPEQKAPERRHGNMLTTVARLRPGVTIERAQQAVDALNVRSLDELPELKPRLIDVGYHSPVVVLHDFLVEDVRRSLTLLWGATLFLLLIGGVNVANLALVRVSGRTAELATRHAMGASRWRLARQMLTENTLLALAGGVAGLVLAYWALELIGALDLTGLTRVNPIALDFAAVGYTATLVLALGLLLGIVPLASLRRLFLGQAFRDEGRSGTASRAAHRTRRVLVAAQVMLALVLLAGSALLLQSFRQLLAVDPGFHLDKVWTGTVTLPATRYPEDGERRAFEARLLERVQNVPDVIAAGTTNVIPFGEMLLWGRTNDGVILAEGQQVQPGEPLISAYQSAVSPGYFEAMGIRLLNGRLFDRMDSEHSMPVMIVDDRLARHFWPGQDPIGKRMFLPLPESFTPDSRTHWITVVGVVSAVRMLGVTGEERPAATYFPSAQRPSNTFTIAVRSSTEPSGLTRAIGWEVEQLDAEMPVYNVRTMEERRDGVLADRRTPMVLSVLFGAVALFLAAIGLYGVLAYQVSLRKREIGIRMALGSDRRRIVGLVIREGMILVGIGIAIGLGSTLLLGRAIASQLYEVRASEPAVLAAVTALLAFVALVACLVPARRASRVDPATALTEL
jgi:predicted permease